VFDLSRLAGGLEVRRAAGTQDYLTFGGETEHPAPGEVIFADEAGRAHARRWTNRQSAWSAVTGPTSAALIVAEALHPSAATAVAGLAETLRAELDAAWSVPSKPVILSADAPRLGF
jgi:DNA/RNA-binding domain of Phe-tRNA-synthetase-like protein